MWREHDPTYENWDISLDCECGEYICLGEPGYRNACKKCGREYRVVGRVLTRKKKREKRRSLNGL